MINTQQAEKLILNNLDIYEVQKIFYTLQGEGPFAGTPAAFVRLAGCNLQCPYCDTDYTSNKTIITAEEIKNDCFKVFPKRIRSRKLVVITGGEPFRQDLTALVRTLALDGFIVQIETNGTIYPGEKFPFRYVTIVCSPKTPKISELLEPYIACFKYVIEHNLIEEDGLPSITLGKYRPARPTRLMDYQQIFVQPLDQQDKEANQKNTQAALQSSLKHGYKLCLQLHKQLNLE